MAFSAHKDPEQVCEIFDVPAALREKAVILAKWIRESSHFVAFTGAGISTSAGISDFRGPNGVWTLRAQGKSPSRGVSTAKAFPTKTHMALVALEQRNILKFLISQNCDGLHRRSGFAPAKLAELHGNSNLDECRKCGNTYLRDFRCRGNKGVHDHQTDRKCVCGGWLYDTIINFGENLPKVPLHNGYKHSRKSDLHLVLGSSLTVSPANDMPEATKRHGGKLVVVNLQKTPLDSICDLRVFGRTDEFMEMVMAELRLDIPDWWLRRRAMVSTSLTKSGDLQLTVTGVEPDGLPASIFRAVQVLLDSVTPLHAMSYTDQLIHKQSASKEVFENLRKQFKCNAVKQVIDEDVLQQIVPSPVVDRYRNKCEFAIGSSSEGCRIGFVTGRKPDGSSCVVSPVACTHIPQTMITIVDVIQNFINASGIEVYNDAFADASKRASANEGFWRMLTVRCFLADNLVIITVSDGVLDADAFTAVCQKLKALFEENSGAPVRLTSLYLHSITNTSDSGTLHHVAGAPYVYETLRDRRFRVSPQAFFQTNTAAAECLYDKVGELAGVNRTSVLLDICCGTGTIGITLASKCAAVLGIELIESAVHDARFNAQLNQLPNAQFMCGRAEQCFADLKHLLPALDPKYANQSISDLPDVIGIVDPPRAGLHGKLIVAIRKLSNLKRLVFVSCDPKAATPNFVGLCKPESNRFVGQPFQLIKVVPVDMFPQTKHIEWVLLFERS